MQTIQLNQISIGNNSNYGFATAQQNIRKALALQGINVAYIADKVLWHISPHLFEKNHNKIDYLWSPYEANKIAKSLVNKLNEADYVIASSEHNKAVFVDGGVTRSISICPLCIDTNIFHYVERKHNGVFRFLFHGQPDIRKGWDLAVKAFQEEFKPTENVELYIKTTGKEKFEVMKFYDKVTFDSRNLALADLIELYINCHVLVFPTRGEGTGLPAMEFMSTGGLVLAPPIMGMKQFIRNDTSIPLEYEMIKGTYGVEIEAPNVLIDDLKTKMRLVYKNFSDYDTIREEGCNFIKENLHLDMMGKRLIEIIWGS